MTPPRSATLPGLLLVAMCVLSGARGKDGPPYEPEEALTTFEIAEGFRIELYAAEPLVMDPVAMEVDENGVVYVVEMPGYPLDVSGSGRVVTLTDTDGDGWPDRRTVFADGLRLPNGILRWKEGILVTDAPDVLYLADTDADGRADVREAVLTGFALSNPQHNVNTPVYGLDNWIHLAHESAVTAVVYGNVFGDEGAEVFYPAHPQGPRLPRNADGRNVRFRPDRYALESESGESQFGYTFDRWGHAFFTHNTYHIFQEALAARYLARNPDLLVPNAVHGIADYGYPAEVYPITENPQHQLLTDVGVVTSGSGIVFYTGGLFPEPYDEAAFVAEPVHNLVHAVRVEGGGALYEAARVLEGREFLASRDSWFRPVSHYVGPDGALYVLDYYRQYVEHPEWMSEEVVRSGALYNGVDRGRIYRIVPESHTAAPAWTNNLALGRLSDAELVRDLESPNLWRRRTAQRLLVDRRSGAPELAEMALDGRTPEGRLHALWTLEGIGMVTGSPSRLTPAMLVRKLSDGSAGVRENAVRIAERYLKDGEITSALLRMTADPDPKVRYQLLLTLGELESDEAAAAREQLLFADVDDEWMQTAALSARATDPARLYREAVRRLSAGDTPGRRAFFRRLGSLIAASDREGAQRLIRDFSSEAPWYHVAALEGLAEGARRNPSLLQGIGSDRASLVAVALSEEPEPRAAALRLLEAAGPSGSDMPEEAAARAVTVARDRGADPARRADAVRLLELARRTADQGLLADLLSADEPDEVQRAAIRAISAVSGTEPARLLLERWGSLGTASRDEALRRMVWEPERTGMLLQAVERGGVDPASIPWQQRVGLMMNDDPALREQARRLLSAPPDAGDFALSRYRQVLDGSGDVARGEAVYERVCSTCHAVGGKGASFGPDLGGLRNRSAESILADIVLPNRSIADDYELWTVETKSGNVHQGTLRAESPSALTLAFPGGTFLTLARADVRSMQASDLSGMPAGLEHQVSIAEMADLLAFLKKRK